MSQHPPDQPPNIGGGHPPGFGGPPPGPAWGANNPGYGPPTGGGYQPGPSAAPQSPGPFGGGSTPQSPGPFGGGAAPQPPGPFGGGAPGGFPPPGGQFGNNPYGPPGGGAPYGGGRPPGQYPPPPGYFPPPPGQFPPPPSGPPPKQPTGTGAKIAIGAGAVALLLVGGSAVAGFGPFASNPPKPVPSMPTAIPTRATPSAPSARPSSSTIPTKTPSKTASAKPPSAPTASGTTYPAGVTISGSKISGRDFTAAIPAGWVASSHSKDPALAFEISDDITDAVVTAFNDEDDEASVLCAGYKQHIEGTSDERATDLPPLLFGGATAVGFSISENPGETTLVRCVSKNSVNWLFFVLTYDEDLMDTTSDFAKLAASWVWK